MNSISSILFLIVLHFICGAQKTCCYVTIISPSCPILFSESSFPLTSKSSESNYFKITEFCPSDLRSLRFLYLWRTPEMALLAPRAIVFRPLFKGSKDSGNEIASCLESCNWLFITLRIYFLEVPNSLFLMESSFFAGIFDRSKDLPIQANLLQVWSSY